MDNPRSWAFWRQPLISLAAGLALVPVLMVVLIFAVDPTADVSPGQISVAPWTVPLSTTHRPGDGN
ncbi:hypothetical protein [Nocardia higoensis]|uniref:hypothetical protein n=1 Tax=Nocardia higoensis TaxID=228599 RepID=UPI000308E60C|nr:hypothetical protein [Nocardia higoensis]